MQQAERGHGWQPSYFHCIHASCHLLAHFLPLSPQMNDNQIDNWSDLDELKNAKSLETVYLERNPLQKDPQYRRKIMLALPTVRQIDATFIRFWAAVYISPDSFSIQKKKKNPISFSNAGPAVSSLHAKTFQPEAHQWLTRRTCMHVCTHSHLDLKLLLERRII